MSLTGIYSAGRLRSAVLIVLSLTAFQLHAADGGVSMAEGAARPDVSHARSSGSPESQAATPRSESGTDQLLPPPPPGPYQSMAFREDAVAYRRYRQGQAASEMPKKAGAPSATAASPSRPSPAARNEQAGADRNMNRVNRNMDMYSPDRPWPDNLRSAPGGHYQQNPADHYHQPPIPSRGMPPSDVRAAYGRPDYIDPRGYDGSNYGYRSRPQSGTRIPPGYWPDNYSQYGNYSEMEQAPMRYSPQGRGYYPEAGPVYRGQ